jgi:DNA-binding CsgD family transcriptional regulator
MVADASRLTKRESEVAVRLAEGQDLAAIADALGIRVAAAWQYLKRVFDKTGVHNCAALVALIRGFAEPWRRAIAAGRELVHRIYVSVSSSSKSRASLFNW